MDYAAVQAIAKETMAYIRSVIEPGMHVADVRRLCEDKMYALGADSFWYWGVGAFVFAGDETALSVSGRDYVTPNRRIVRDDIVTIDLSPQCGSTWGDYARTLVIEQGKVVEDVKGIQNDAWRRGLAMESRLHQELMDFADKGTTFEELYLHINGIITRSGFVNLDFLGNLGHSIVKHKDERIYTEKGNRARLGSVDFFTFEPHIGMPGSPWGYKMENIYYFSRGKLTEL